MTYLYRSILLALLGSAALAQTPTRTEQWEKRRVAEGGVYGDDERSLIETGAQFLEDKRLLERFSRGIGGVRVVLGNLMPGAGFALGPEYYRDEIRDGAVQFRVAARASLRKNLLGEAEFALPRLWNDKLQLDLYTRWRNFNNVPYYGLGPDSLKSQRTAFRLEDAAYEFHSALQPKRGLKLAAGAGILQINVGRGDDPRYGSSELLFAPRQAPGIDVQSRFVRTGVLASYDWRDYPGGAKYGGFYEARFDYFRDTDAERYTHRRLTLEAQQTIPFANRRRVISLRAKSLLTFENTNQILPFFLMPMLGGQNDMRGFRFGRFYGNNALVMNAEYRWEIFTGLDGALFYDAGKVFQRRGQLNFRDLEGSAGFGFRVNARNTTFLRFDVGFSHEGFQLWMSFNDVFGNSGGVAQNLYTSRYR
jgi:hypothetical protein